MNRSGRYGGRLAVAAASAALVLALPAAAMAQAPVASFEDLGTRLRAGDTIYVADGDGGERKGKLLELTPSMLLLDDGGARREFPADRVSSIKWRKPDPLGNGALIGLGVGVGAATAWALAWCSSEDCDAGATVLGVAVYGAIGAGIGVGIDALIPGKKVLVFQRATAGPPVTLRFSPLVVPKGQGVAVSLGF